MIALIRIFRPSAASFLAPVSILALIVAFAATRVAAQETTPEAPSAETPTASAPAAAALEWEVRAAHGSWEIVCVKGTEHCVMQQIGKDSQGADALGVRISKINAARRDGTAVPAMIEITTRDGVLLQAGVRLQIDGGDVRGAPYGICAGNLCVVQDAMSEKFVAEMKAGQGAKVTMFLPPDRAVGIDIALNGFTKAYDSLTPLPQRN